MWGSKGPGGQDCFSQSHTRWLRQNLGFDTWLQTMFFSGEGWGRVSGSWDWLEFLILLHLSPKSWNCTCLHHAWQTVFFNFFSIFTFNYVYVCVCVCVSVCMWMHVPTEIRGVGSSRSYLIWMLGIELRPSGKTVSTLNCWATLPAPDCVFNYWGQWDSLGSNGICCHPDDPSLIPKIHIVEGENHLPRVVPWPLHACPLY